MYSPCSPSFTRRSSLHPLGKRFPRGFTLVELLVVLAIIGILTGISISLIPSMLRGQQINQSVLKLSGILEQARSDAITKNSYVWVAFTAPSATAPANGIWVATLTSADGSEALVNSNGTWVTTTNAPSGSLQMLGRPENLRGVQIVPNPSSSGSFTDLINASGNTTLVTSLQTTLAWTIASVQNAEGFSTNLFTQGIEFTPSGEARAYLPTASPTWYNHIQFVLQPSLGSSTNSALYNVGRSTGKVSVYRR